MFIDRLLRGSKPKRETDAKLDNKRLLRRPHQQQYQTHHHPSYSMEIPMGKWEA
jgi:hypothetical protein